MRNCLTYPGPQTAVLVEPDSTSVMPEVHYNDERNILCPMHVEPIRTRSRCKPTPSPSSVSPSETEGTDDDTKDVEMHVPYFATGTAVVQKEPVFTGYMIDEQGTQFVAPFGQPFHDFDVHSAPGPSPINSNFSFDSVSSPDDMLLSLSGEHINFSNGSGVLWGHDHYIKDQQFLFTVGNDEPLPTSDLYSTLAYMPLEEPRNHASMTHVTKDHKTDGY